MYKAIFLCLVLASCAPTKLVSREGKIVDIQLTQAGEQCRAQPDLDWCKQIKQANAKQ